MTESKKPRFALVGVTPTSWIVRDLRFGTAEHRSAVAAVHKRGAGVDVRWFHDLPLGSRFASAPAVLRKLRELHASPEAPCEELHG